MSDPTKVLRPRRRLWLLGGLAFVLALVGLGVGSVVATIEGLPDTKPSNAAASPSAEPSESPSPSPSPSPSIPDGAIAIPEVVGKRLPEADKLLKDAGLTVKVRDASGANRIIIEKNNWIVVSTDPAVYTTPDRKSIYVDVRKPTDGKGSQTVENGVMPDVKCKDLQDAKDFIKRAGFRVVVSNDVSGKKRSMFFEREWIVIGQSEAPGTRPTAFQRIELQVIRYGEPVGDSGCES